MPNDFDYQYLPCIKIVKASKGDGKKSLGVDPLRRLLIRDEKVRTYQTMHGNEPKKHACFWM